jgi:hypothetical protein
MTGRHVTKQRGDRGVSDDICLRRIEALEDGIRDIEEIIEQGEHCLIF